MDKDKLLAELQAANAKIQDLISKLEAVVNQYRSAQNSLALKEAELFDVHLEADKEHELNITKITELEQKLKNCISIDAHLEWKREWEQQLNKAEEIIGFDINSASSGATMNHANKLEAYRQYLKSRGE